MKSYRFFGEEMEVLGQRLDAARKAVKEAKTPWAKTYWAAVVERLLFQWRQLPALHDGDAKVTIIPRWQVGYDFYETSYKGEGNSVADRAYHKLFRESVNLDASWHNHREQRLARAQF
jgi:hypothetical protein